MNTHINRYVKTLFFVCNLSVILNSFAIFFEGILPILIKHPNSELIYTSKYGFELFIQILYAYFALIFGVLLFNRSRLIWSVSASLMLLVAICNAIWWHNYFTLFLAGIALVSLFIMRKWYNRDIFVSYKFIFVVGFLVFALLYGSLGVYLLRNDFNGIKNLGDAIYFTIVTYSTVGYGDIYPQTFAAKCFVISMIVIGLIVFTSSITLIAYKVNMHLKKVLYNINKGKVGMTNHIILSGYGIVAKMLIQRYQKENQEFLVIDTDKVVDHDRQLLIDDNRLLIAPYFGNSNTLMKAQAELASKIMVCFETDEATIVGVMNTKEYLELKKLAIQPKIVALILYQENINKAIRAGADEVIAPYILAAEKILCDAK